MSAIRRRKSRSRFDGHVPEHACLAGGDVEQPREHLQRRRLAGAVRPQEADDLAGRDVERDAVDGLDLPHPAADETLRRRLEPRLALGHVERLAELRDVDDRRPATALQLPVTLRVPLAAVEDPEAERHGDGADDEQRPDLVPHRVQRRRRRGSPRECRRARTSPARSSRAPASTPAALRHGVVDARDDEQRALGDEAELRPLLRGDERQDGHHHPDADERDRRRSTSTTNAAT